MLEEGFLKKKYIVQKQSVFSIARDLHCSENKVNYWLAKYKIPKRSIGDALYSHHNPQGDPFQVRELKTPQEWYLYGLGLGLFWGEGNKVNKNYVRLGNSDPSLIKLFLKFLRDIYRIEESKLKFGLQLFNDVSPQEALSYWVNELKVSKKNFQKVVITKSFKSGTYKKKSKYGVLTVYFPNTKLRDTIMHAITELRK